MNLALWIVQGFLCAVFLLAGGTKVFAYDKYKMTESKSPVQSRPFERAREFHWDL
jgi:hypothetical protein